MQLLRLVLVLTVLLCGAPIHAQTLRDLVADPPPCDSQNSAHREVVKAVLEAHESISVIERNYSITGSADLPVEIRRIIGNPQNMACAENLSLSLIALVKLLAVVYEKADIQLDIGNSEDLAPLLEKWQAWATEFISEELKTQIWLGSFSNFRGQGIEVGCESYLLPVDTGLARGRNTLAELSLALSALFDPEQNHPAPMSRPKIGSRSWAWPSLAFTSTRAWLRLG